MDKKNYQLESLTAVYIQDADCQAEHDAQNTIEIHSEAISFEMDFLTIKTDRWSFDSPEEFTELLNDFKSKLK